jgi:hypothetical protein
MTINGTPVNFGFQGTNGITMTGLSGTLLQSADLSTIAEREVTRNGVGEKVTSGWYGFGNQSSLEWVVTGTTLADALAQTTIQTPGTIIVISACTSIPGLVATNWEVQAGSKVSGSNTNAKRITMPLEKNALITAVAT